MTLNRPIKIVFILPTLFAGGSERIFSFLAQNIDKNQFDTTLLVIGKSDEAAYEVNGVKVVFFEKPRVLKGIRSLFLYLRKTNPDIVMSAITHLNFIMAYVSILFPRTKFIARESTVLSVDAQIFQQQQTNIISDFLETRRFKIFDKIICQSTDIFNDLQLNQNLPDHKLIIINNPITNNLTVKKAKFKNHPLRLITIGRLSKEKGIQRILSLLSKVEIPFHYTLIGDGPEREEIMLLVKHYNLQNNLTHIPFTKNVAQHLSENDYFLQGSYVEGFPNAVLESCVVGTPVIAFDAPGGTKEIIVNGLNGFLVNTEDEFLEKLQENREWNPEEISESVYKKFNKEKIIKEYEALFFDILNKKKV